MTAAALLLMGFWFELSQRVENGTRDAEDPPISWRTPIHFGFYSLYVFGRSVKYRFAAHCFEAAGVIAVAIAAVQIRVGVKRLADSRYCRQCGYDVSHSPSNICSECGAVIASKKGADIS